MLKVSISGVRGIVPQDFNPEVVIKYINAFSRVLDGNRVLLARDTRPHGELFYDIAKRTLQFSGKEVYSIGIAPTPTAQFINRGMDLDGGIILTASHNPIEWNALKLSGKGGRFLYKEELDRMLELIGSFEWSEKWGNVVEINDAVERHIEAILKSPLTFEKSSVRVVADCVNGAMYKALPSLLRNLGADVKEIYCEPTGEFLRSPEPRGEYLGHLNEFLNGDFELAFATDPDGDRMVFGVKGRGILSEEMTIVAGIDYILSKEKGDVVVNYSTSILVEFVAQNYGVRVFRAPVGEANVLKRMEEVGAIVGGEGNGGLIFPKINATRDGLLSAAVIYSSYVDGRLMELLESLPQTYMFKGKVETENVEDVLEKFQPIVEGFELITEDGYYFRKGYSWLHIRPSNTEPIVRVYAESLEKGFVDRVKEMI